MVVVVLWLCGGVDGGGGGGGGLYGVNLLLCFLWFLRLLWWKVDIGRLWLWYRVRTQHHSVRREDLVSQPLPALCKGDTREPFRYKTNWYFSEKKGK